MRILIVDDSNEIQSRLVRLVTAVKKTRVIGLAGNGADALKLINALKPDLVILDLQMPKKNGLAVIKWITDHHLPTAVLVLTNFATAHHAAMCEKLGAAYFFDKMTEIEPAIEKIGELASAGTGRKETGLRNGGKSTRHPATGKRSGHGRAPAAVPAAGAPESNHDDRPDSRTP
jgi:DNA-binding NarL/FixJ family response regulator